MKDSDERISQLPAEALDVETLQREKEALSEQVKRLIKAEGRLYEYQQELDAQLNEYKELYEFNRRLNGTFTIENIFHETVRYVIEHLEYERALCFQRDEQSGDYRVCAMDGYYDSTLKDQVARLTIRQHDTFLLPLLTGSEFIICTADSPDTALCELRKRLFMHGYVIYPLGSNSLPHALLVVGNSAENALFYRKIDDSRGALVSMGNLVGLVSSLVQNRIFFQQMEQARQQEKHAEARYRSIFENAIEGIFQRTPEGRYLEANSSLARMFGYGSAGELMDEVSDIRRQLYVDRKNHDELVALLQRDGAVEGFEVPMYRKDRSVIWASLSMRVVRDGAGEVLFYEGTAEEITKRKKAEEALRESEQKYRQLSEDLEQRVKEAVDELRQKDKILILQGRQAVMGEMISNIAHQWRQPLNMLALLVQDLQITFKKEGLTEEFIDANVKRSLEIIHQMSKTIDYFRYFFKPDKEKVEFRVAETVERTLSILAGSFNTHGIQIDLERSGDPIVNGYQTEFIQVLLNILINARDALATTKPAAPVITIRLFTKGERTVVTIADNAGGIPEAILDRIFEPYFTTKGPEQGTGIGLFMCKTIIEKNMGGRLAARNLEDGAEFRIEV